MREASALTDSVYMARQELDHPVLDPPADKVFSFIVYNKGARILDMLRGVSRLHLMKGALAPPESFAEAAQTGDERFFRTFSRHAGEHAFGNVTTSDYQQIAEEELGEDLDWFFDPWLNGESYPRLEYDWVSSSSAQGTALHVHLRLAESAAPFIPMPLHVRYRSGSTILDEVRTLKPEQQWVVELPQGEWEVILDPDDWFLETHERKALVTGIPQMAAFPNPSSAGFDLLATLEGTAPEPVSLSIYDVQGRRVRTLDLGQVDPGPVIARWDGRADDGRLARPGSYFARFILGSRAVSRRLVVLP
jgi:hypothetical protein